MADALMIPMFVASAFLGPLAMAYVTGTRVENIAGLVKFVAWITAPVWVFFAVLKWLPSTISAQGVLLFVVAVILWQRCGN